MIKDEKETEKGPKRSVNWRKPVEYYNGTFFERDFLMKTYVKSLVYVLVIIVVFGLLAYWIFPMGKLNPDRETKVIVANMNPIPKNFRDSLGWSGFLELLSGNLILEKSMSNLMHLDPNDVMTVRVYCLTDSDMSIKVNNKGYIETRSLDENGYVQYFAKVYDKMGGYTWRLFREQYSIEVPEGYFALSSVELGSDNKLLGTFKFNSAIWKGSVAGWVTGSIIISFLICIFSWLLLCRIRDLINEKFKTPAPAQPVG
jgi:hypothetical protein